MKTCTRGGGLFLGQNERDVIGARISLLEYSRGVRFGTR